MIPLPQKTVWWLLKKLYRELPYDLAILLLNMYTIALKTSTQTDACTPMFIAEVFTIAKQWKQSK